jgi:DNA-binding transcriptional MocR family regulator
MRTGPSDTFIAHKAISLSDDLSGTEKRVAATIIDHFNRKTGQCDPALNSIASLLGVSRRTIIRAIGMLVCKGYFRKTRHGGNFHRNSYTPDWSRFRAKEQAWNERRTAASRRFGSAAVSPLQGQPCQVAGEADVTQTCQSNHLKKTHLHLGREMKRNSRARRQRARSSPEKVEANHRTQEQESGFT